MPPLKTIRSDYTRYAEFLPGAFRRHVVIPPQQTACWRWTGKVGPDGYGTGPGNTTAQAWSWRLNLGELSPAQRVVQTCGDKLCVNPLHLKLERRR